jgi:hypothetical protein
MEVLSNDQNTSPDEFRGLLAALDHLFMSVDDYNAAVAAGALQKMGIYEDDTKFQRLNPDHPRSVDNRSIRIHAADTFMYAARARTQPYPREVLDRLHASLFDCCATVRYSIAVALGVAGDASSIPFLQRLVETEKDSAGVLEEARNALTILSAGSVK